MTITQEDGFTLISLGNMEIWDGADLALIRDTLIEQVQKYNRRVLTVDMESVKYIPSGFFGMLSEWKDRGISIAVKGVQQNVANMLWFQQFFVKSAPGYYQLQGEPQFEMNTIFAEPDDQNDPLPADSHERLEAEQSLRLEQAIC